MAARFVLSKGNALVGISSVKENAGKEEHFDRLASKKGEPYFVLKAGNAQIIGKSEMYASERSRNNGIASVRRNAAIANIEDRSGA